MGIKGISINTNNKYLYQRFLVGLIVFSILLGCFAPSINAIEMKALFMSCNIFEKNPLIVNYYDIIEFSQSLIVGFYISERIAKGLNPEAQKKSFPKKQQTQQQDRALFGGQNFNLQLNSSQTIKSSFSKFGNLFDSENVIGFLDLSLKRFRGSPQNSIPIYLLFLFLYSLILPRGSLDLNSIQKIYNKNMNPAKIF